MTPTTIGQFFKNLFVSWIPAIIRSIRIPFIFLSKYRVYSTLVVADAGAGDFGFEASGTGTEFRLASPPAPGYDRVAHLWRFSWEDNRNLPKSTECVIFTYLYL